MGLGSFEDSGRSPASLSELSQNLREAPIL